MICSSASEFGALGVKKAARGGWRGVGARLIVEQSQRN